MSVEERKRGTQNEERSRTERLSTKEIARKFWCQKCWDNRLKLFLNISLQEIAKSYLAMLFW